MAAFEFVKIVFDNGDTNYSHRKTLLSNYSSLDTFNFLTIFDTNCMAFWLQFEKLYFFLQRTGSVSLPLCVYPLNRLPRHCSWFHAWLYLLDPDFNPDFHHLSQLTVSYQGLCIDSLRMHQANQTEKSGADKAWGALKLKEITIAQGVFDSLNWHHLSATG